MGSVKNKVDKVMNKVADKIMPKELAKVTPYLAMAAPFLGPVGMLATLPAQALADAKNYGKLNYKKLALQAAMTGLAKAGGGGNLKGAPPATGAEKAFSAKALESGVNPRFLSNDLAMGSQAFAENAGDAFTNFAKDFSYAPGIEGIGQRVADTAIKTGRAMNMPLQFGEDAPSISDQLFNLDRAKQAALMLGPMTTYAGMDALDQMEAGQGGGSGGSEGMGAQALYNDFLQSGRLAGYTDDEINTIYGPYGDMAGGDYQTVNVDRGPRRRQFPGTNYNLFTYANGGRVNKALGGAIGMALREAMEAAAKNPNLFKVLNPKEGIGQVIEMMKKLPKVKPRDRRTEGIDIFGKRRPRDIDQYQDEIIRQMEEMDSFAAGGRVGYAEGDVVNPMNLYGGPHKEEDIGIYDFLDARNERERIARELRAAQKVEAIERAQNMYDVVAERNEELTDMGFDVPPMKTIEEMFPKMDFNPSLYNNGGRVGFSEGELVSPEQILMVRPEKGGPIPDELVDRTRQKRMSLTGAQPPRPEEDEELKEQILREILSPGVNEDSIADQMYNMQLQEMMNPRMGRANGGITQVAPGVPAGMELDYRNTGGFIPMGGPERADDVPAMLSKNEFVMTADAVRGMGDGDINTGAQRMYDLMNNMEAKV